MSAQEALQETLHASCVVVGETGILIRGAAGAGKSTLAREIIQAARLSGLFARLVADDRTRIMVRHGRLVASPVAPLCGLVEIRGIGIVQQSFEPAAVLRLVVDLMDSPPRYPEKSEQYAVLWNIRVPRLHVQARTPTATAILGCLSCVCDTVMTL